MRNNVGLLVLASLALWGCSSRVYVDKEEVAWQPASSMGDLGRSGATSTAVDGKGYVGCGNAPDGSYLHDFWAYDAATNKWEQKTDYPGKGGHAVTSFAINGKVYFCLGFAGRKQLCNDVWEYDPLSNRWSQKRDFPGQGRYSAKSFVIGKYAYVGTGSYDSSSEYLGDFWRYDPEVDKWEQVAAIPVGRCGAVAFSVNGKGYCGLGIDEGGSFLNALKDFWEYDPATNQWSQLPDFPGLRYGAFGFGLGDAGYVGGGFDKRYFYNDMWRLNIDRRCWEKVESPSGFAPRMGATPFIVNGKAYVGTGDNSLSILSDFWIYTPGKK